MNNVTVKTNPAVIASYKKLLQVDCGAQLQDGIFELFKSVLRFDSKRFRYPWDKRDSHSLDLSLSGADLVTEFLQAGNLELLIQDKPEHNGNGSRHNQAMRVICFLLNIQ